MHLTPTEWGILEMLARNPGKLIGREEVTSQTRCGAPTYAKESHYLRVYLAQLRRKLEDDPVTPAASAHRKQGWDIDLSVEGSLPAGWR